jgi:TonB family protein
MRDNALFVGTLSEQPSLALRLIDEFKEASRACRANPVAYIQSAFKDGGVGNRRRKALFRFGLAMGILAYALFFACILIVWTINAKPPLVARTKPGRVIQLPPFRPQDKLLPQSDRDAGGGGGGGGNSSLPATIGAPPPFSPDHPLNAPTTRPTLQPPLFPIAERLLGDPAHNVKRDEMIPTGLPDGVIGPQSDGPGSEGGIGTGKRGGVGPDKGPGSGPGEDGGQNGGPYSMGGRRDGPDAAQAFDTRPLPLNRPRPNYTEEARKDKIQGTVRTLVLVGADGRVKRVKVVGLGLSGGLNEEAIQAAFQMRFSPATKNGRAVECWIALEIEFNLR